MPSAHGQFVWHDLKTSSRKAAQSFYPAITSWGIQQSEVSPKYDMWTNHGIPVGGVEELSDALIPEHIGPHWLPYVCVYDVDACTRQVSAIGGTVRLAPTEIPTVGDWAVVADPQGALIGLFEPDGAAPAGGETPGVGEFSWHELMAADYKAAFEFYREIFQWEKIREFDMGLMGMYFIFGKNGQTYGGMFNRTPDMPAPNWLSYVRVPDVHRAANEVTRLGGKVVMGPTEVPGGDWIAQCIDAQGATFALHTPKAT